MAALCFLVAVLGGVWTLALLLGQVIAPRWRRWRETPTLLRNDRSRPEWWFVERTEED